MKDDRKKELFANAMSNLTKNKLGISLDLLNEIIDTDADDKLDFAGPRVGLSENG